MQYASLAIAQELPIDGLSITVRGHNLRELPSSFRDVIFHVHLEGALSQSQLESLAREASRHCFAENTLEKGIPITTEVSLNGKRSLTINRGPAPAPNG